ncbi:hypothetical protein M406DRAFT_55873 [Cryphonectria parasitica EP155]|uniref:Uncharacterized protein n=1 Tax=Cryphonectria parasitica (strain ATCC 38755 / EP155) TaxID=660469 RepID=A0A9P4Y066_CRYP1|nr:uncharacterized protein M406DRAFT_55873 [Cryphonectria parasitica EP155]KAF3764574.1 hypothetical protein M406DRAFT_55873 [Cryphonectria parasitica EP155]
MDIGPRAPGPEALAIGGKPPADSEGRSEVQSRCCKSPPRWRRDFCEVFLSLFPSPSQASGRRSDTAPEEF